MLLPAPPPEEARGGSAAVHHVEGELASLVHVAASHLREAAYLDALPAAGAPANIRGFFKKDFACCSHVALIL